MFRLRFKHVISNSIKNIKFISTEITTINVPITYCPISLGDHLIIIIYRGLQHKEIWHMKYRDEFRQKFSREVLVNSNKKEEVTI